MLNDVLLSGEDCHDTIRRLSLSCKNKSASGLGSLAYAHSQGDMSTISGEPTDKHIRIISEAIRRPDDYWRWISNTFSCEGSFNFLRNAKRIFQSANWAWDKAFAMSAAYLFLALGEKGDSEQSVKSTISNEIKFPYWVAIDMHTRRGKVALRQVAHEIRTPYEQLKWISFYMESSLVNKSHRSYWWDREKEWRLRTVQTNETTAHSIWEEARGLFRIKLEHEARYLEQRIYDVKDRISLFNQEGEDD